MGLFFKSRLERKYDRMAKRAAASSKTSKSTLSRSKGVARKSAAGKKAVSSNLSDIEIPIGPCQIPVEGLEWCKLPLSNNPDRVFSLTPRNHYQEEQGWPETGCLNVNRNGSKRTTEKNWVGYIKPAFARKLNAVVMSHGTTRVHARVLNGTVTLLIPTSYR